MKYHTFVERLSILFFSYFLKIMQVVTHPEATYCTVFVMVTLIPDYLMSQLQIKFSFIVVI